MMLPPVWRCGDNALLVGMLIADAIDLSGVDDVIAVSARLLY